jgi:pyruvyltransferase
MGLDRLFWSGPKKPNWGDILNRTLFRKISNNTPVWTNFNSNERYYMCIGSILEKATPNSIIWGSGFMHQNGTVFSNPPDSEFTVTAVRGPLSREKLIEQGINCPEVYGDPALLYPRFYNPSVKKKYKWGIIPHYADWNNPMIEMWKDKKSEGVKVINILNQNPKKFVNEVLECEIILSSSLHGIICGDAYGIPSYWIKLSDLVLGNGFKFKDYFASVKRLDENPIEWDGSFDNLDLIPYVIDIDLDKLFDVCPFKIDKK